MKKLQRILIFSLSLILLVNMLSALSRKAPVPVIISESPNDFTFKMYSQLKENPGNVFFSPYSISSAIALTYNGSKENTFTQIADVMAFSRDLDKFNLEQQMIYNNLNKIGEKGDVALRIANSLWLEKNFSFNQDFIKVNESYYNAKPFDVDFKRAPDKSREMINKWVENQTENKIKDLLAPGTVNSGTRLVLANAIYFKGTWEKTFNKKSTRDLPFFLVTNQEIKAPLMYKKTFYKYYENEKFQALSMDYKGKELSMLIILPKVNNGIDELENNINNTVYNEIVSNLHSTEVKIFMPKFSFTSQFELAKTIANMGMSDAFNPKKADFSGIEPTKSLFISNIAHKAFVDVNEVGTEAAAATAIGMMTTSYNPDIKEFKANHPFLFLIKENSTNQILFMGRILNPTE